MQIGMTTYLSTRTHSWLPKGIPRHCQSHPRLEAADERRPLFYRYYVKPYITGRPVYISSFLEVCRKKPTPICSAPQVRPCPLRPAPTDSSMQSRYLPYPLPQNRRTAHSDILQG